MAYMVAYEQRLIELAYVLIKEKSNEDDIKASEDLKVLGMILGGTQTCFNLYDNERGFGKPRRYSFAARILYYRI